MQKFIAFNNVEDLERKLESLKNITEYNKQAITEFLLIKNIPFQEIGDGYGADLSAVSPEVMKEYLQTFGDMNQSTLQVFKDLGVIYITPPSIIETNTKLGIQFNLKTREN